VRVPFLATDVNLRIETGLGTYDRIFLGENNSIAEEVVVKTGAGNCIVNLQGGNGDDQTTARVDFGSGPLGKGNKLIVFSEGLAKLAPVDGSHRVFVDEVTVSGAGFDERGSFIVEEDATIDRITLSNYADARIKAGATVATSFDVAAQATVSVEAPVGIGAFTVDGTVDFTVGSAPSTVTEFKLSAALVQDATGTVNINTGANVTALATSRIGTLRIPGTGTFTLQPHTSGQPRRVLSVKSLFMGNDPTQPAGVLDLTDNGMIVDYAFSTPHDYFKALITEGYNGGAWTGNGIRSSTAAADAINPAALKTGVGYAENDPNGGGFGYTSFLAQPVDASTVLARYALYGDTNLDGQVNLADFNQLAEFFGRSGRNWLHGDSSYEGDVNLLDFNRLAANFGFSVDPSGDDGGGESLLGGEPEYTYDELLAILMQMYPQYF
jgi:hypothetical protein